MTPQEADSCDRETKQTARAGTTARQTSAAFELVYGPEQPVLSVQENRDSSPCHMGKLKRKY